jgi:uncharacterized protein
MMPDGLTIEEKKLLLKLARQAIEKAAGCTPSESVDLPEQSTTLSSPGSSFVTLTCRGELRGCIGSLEATRPLAEDVCVHAVAAGFEDYRFPPINREELPDIKIEISRLTPMRQLEYQNPDELLSKLRPHVDGVVIYDGRRRATFLPQVWEKIPSPEIFLNYLCMKLGSAPDAWRCRPYQVWVYQVEKFYE